MKESNYTKQRTGYIFLLIFILLAAGIATGGFYSFRNYEKNYRAEIENQLSAIANLKVSQIEAWRKERLGDGQIFYKNDSFSGMVKRYIQNKNDRNAKTGILSWAAQVQSAYRYDFMMLLDAQLNTILVFPENKERTRLVIDQNNLEILWSRKIAFQDFYRNEQDHQIYLKILVPILENRFSKRLIGVLALRISPDEYLYPNIKKWPTPSRTAETLLIRKDGNDALFLNDLKFSNDAALNLRIPLTRKDVLAVKAALGSEGIVEGIDYRGEPVIGYVCPVPNSPWFIVARMDISEVYAPLRERLWLIIILIAAFIGGAGSSVGFVWRHQSSRFYREQFKSSEALRDSETRYRRLFEAARDGILILDAETGMIVAVNPFLIEMLGYSLEEFLGKKIWELGFFKDIIANQEKFLELQLKEFIRYEDLPLETINGKKINVEFVSNVYLVDHHKVIQCNIRDITERKRVEVALKESQSLYHSFIEQLPNAVFRKDREGRYVLVNPEFCRLKGAKKEDFIGRKPKEVAASELQIQGIEGHAIKYANVGEDMHEQIIQSGRIFKTEEEYLSTDGGIQYMDVVRMPVFDSHRMIIGTQGIMFDISERKRLSMQIEEERNKLASLLNSIPDEVWFADTEKKFTLANPSAIKEFGLDSIDNLDVENFVKSIEILHPDGSPRPVEESPPLRALAGEVVKNLEEIVRIPTRQELRYRQVNAAPVKDAAGKIIGAISVVRDITEIKRSEEKLSLLSTRQEAILSAVPDIIMEVNNNKVYTWANRSGIDFFGDDVIGKEASFYFEGDQETYKAVQPLFKGDENVIYLESWQRRKDGEKRLLAWWCRVLKNENGKVTGALSSASDITERKLAEDEILTLNAELEQRVLQRTSQLQAANKELEAFSYSVSHDLRAPLRHIGGYVELLGEQYQKELPEKGRHYLGEIIDSTRQMGVLIDDLLKFSKTGRVEMHESVMDMNQIVKEVSERLRLDNPQRTIEWTIAQLPSIQGDKAMLQLVWENLLSNAVKFTHKRKNAKIEIGFREEDKEFVFFVHDNGAGFDMQYAQKLFGVFQRLHSAAEFEGTGIGLANVHRIITRHGGRAWAEAEVDKGATFYFSLPK